VSGPVLDFDPQAASLPQARAAETREAPGMLDLIGAGARVEADRVDQVQDLRRAEAYRPLIEALVENGVDRRDLHHGAPGMFGIGPELLGMPDYERIWREARRRGVDGLPETREAFEQNAFRRGGERDRDQETLGRAEGVAGVAAGFVGAMAGSFADPINVYSLPFGGAGRTIAQRILSEGLVGAGVEGAQALSMSDNYARMGEEYGIAEAAQDIAVAGAGAAALRGGIEIAPGIDARAYDLARPVREAIDGAFAERDIARAFARSVPEELRTPEQEAALHLLTRQAEVEESSPYVATHEAVDRHVSQMEEALAALEEGRIARPVEPGGEMRPEVEEVAPLAPARAAQSVPSAAAAARADFGQVKAAIRGPESGGNDGAENALGSSASGRYQFIESTFKRLYAREFGGGGGAASRAWATRRFDVGIQERLMDRLLADNASQLERAGVVADTGNLYLAHFAGAAKAVELARAPRDAPVSAYFSQRAIAQNPAYLGGGKTVGQAIDVIRGKVGGGVGVPAAGARETRLGNLELDDEPVLRPEALDAERPLVSVGGQAVPIARIEASAIGVDAELMQFKSGGDAFGVTDRLQGIEEWDPIAAGMVTVWEGADGRRLIADGHQRLGLARRIEAQGGGSIGLNAFVLRESEGYSEVDARIVTALKNIGEGTGTAVDAAKVFRDVGPEGEALLRRLPPRSALVRDGKALSRLGDDAFGAVVNEVIPENYGAAIGALVPDRALHSAMVRILVETEPPNRVQAEAILRQALEAGFTRETQDSLFGSEELVTGLFAQRAKLLDRALREMRKMKGAFQVAARNAETLESGGNRIDVAGSQASADGNARALALVDRLALRKGNAVNELLDQAARRLADGDRIAAVLRDFVAGIRGLDLDKLDVGGEAGSARAAGDGAGGSGRAGEPQGQAGQYARDEAARDSGEELTPRERDALAEQGDHSPLIDDDAARLFDDDAGDGVRSVSESVWHDIEAQADFAAPTAAQRRTALEQQAEGRARAVAPQRAAGEDGGLFDNQDTTGSLFDLDDGKGPRAAAAIRGEIEAERSGLEEIRKCLK
jgi:hypothetical protein